MLCQSNQPDIYQDKSVPDKLFNSKEATVSVEILREIAIYMPIMN